MNLFQDTLFSLELRSLQESDIYTLVEWELAERPYPWSFENFKSTIHHESQFSFVWEQNSIIFGYGVLQWTPPETYLLNIMVHPRKRRLGLGEKLLKKLIEVSRSLGNKEMILDVDPENLAAVELYKKVNFEVLEERKHAYPRGENSITMRVKL